MIKLQTKGISTNQENLSNKHKKNVETSSEEDLRLENFLSI